MNALLIMCHKNAEHVIRFASRCHTENTDVFIHCDSKMPNEEYERVKSFSENAGGGYYLIDKRIHGEIDKRSLVDIVMEMVYKAYQVESENKKHYSYYMLCSGQDYIIKPMHEIEQILQNIYPMPLIDITPYSEGNWVYCKFNNCNRRVLQYKNWITDTFEKGLMRSVLRVTQLIMGRMASLFRCVPAYACIRHGIKMYGGSAWWILPDQIMEFIHEEYCIEDNFITDILLNHTWTPEETYFQIMTMRSPLANCVKVNPPKMVEQNCKTWAYFSDEGKPFMGHPYVLTEAEFEKIRSSECWFARKFDVSVDSVILDRIDKEILEIE